MSFAPSAAQAPLPRPEHSFLSAGFVIFCLCLFSLPVTARLLFDFLAAGDGWRQGEWLINFGSGLVRRGLMGEVFIWFSDASGLPLRLVTVGGQALLWTGLMILSLLIWWRYPHRNLLLLFAASPMIFLMLWAGDVQGIMRKEILGYIAFASLVLAALSQRSGGVWTSLALIFFTLGLIGNILHLFLTPAMLVGLYLLKTQGRLSASAWILSSVITIAMALLWFGFALIFKDIPELAGACAPLTERGMTPDICNHAIRWLVAGDVDHSAEVFLRVTLANVAQFSAMAFLGVVPLLIAAYLLDASRRVAVLALVCFIPMLPLYGLATDWGRWFSISYTVTISLVLISQVTRPLSAERQPSGATLALLITLAFVMTPAHGIGWQAGGVAASLVKTVQDLF